MLENQLVVKQKVVNKNFLQNHFLQDDHFGFLEDVEVTLSDKTQVCDPTIREYQWMRTLKTLYPDGFDLEIDYQILSFLILSTCFSSVAFLGSVQQQVIKYGSVSPMTHF